jgi:hypothetical protein
MAKIMSKQFRLLIIALIVITLFTACSTTHVATQSKRAAIEQLLLSEALIRSLPQEADSLLPISTGANVFLEISGISGDEKLVRDVLAGWLGQQGYFVQNEAAKASYRINAILSSFGTEAGKMLVGVPEVEGNFISIGELAFYKAEYQTGYANFFFDIFELPSGRHIFRTSSFLAETFYNYYTAFLIFDFNRTNLIKPPRLHSFQHE